MTQKIVRKSCLPILSSNYFIYSLELMRNLDNCFAEIVLNMTFNQKGFQIDFNNGWMNNGYYYIYRIYSDLDSRVSYHWIYYQYKPS